MMVGGKIQMIWTTKAHDDDAAMGLEAENVQKFLVSGGDEDAVKCPSPFEAHQSTNCADSVVDVQTAIEVYFNGFVGHNASAMQSAFHQSGPLFMADFDWERKAPVACAMAQERESEDACLDLRIGTAKQPVGVMCPYGTFPLISTYDALLPAFEAFVEQPSHIQLNRAFTPAGVHGDFAYVSTVSYGCEGNQVTPAGEPPAPNRELFVATRSDADGWKIQFYMFSIDPASPIDPPVETCDLSRDTPGSVWPSE